MSMQELPPGMLPATGRFRYRSQSGGMYDLGVSHAKFILWKNFEQGHDAEGVQLNLMIATHPVEIADESGDPDLGYQLEPALTVEWLTIDESVFASRDRGALDGYRHDFDWDKEPDALEAPAAIQDGSYGSTETLSLALRFVAPDRYQLQAVAEDEFGRRCEIDAELPLFQIGASNFSMSQPPAIEAWLKRYFDLSDLDVAWRTVGPMTNQWQNLYASFKETEGE